MTSQRASVYREGEGADGGANETRVTWSVTGGEIREVAESTTPKVPPPPRTRRQS